MKLKLKNLYLYCVLVNCFFYFLKLLSIDNFGCNSIGRFINIELYSDVLIYESWLKQLKEGMLLYTQIGYQYTPLFIQLLYIFSLIPFRLSFTIPIFISNMLTGCWVGKIANKLWLKSRNIIMFYYLNPFTLLYASFSLFSSCIFILFSIISFYYLISKKYKKAFVFIGISIMVKQYAVFQLIIMLLIVIRERKGVLIIIKGLLICCLIFLLCSGYYLIVERDIYLNKITYNIFNKLTQNISNNVEESFVMEYNLGVDILTFIKFIGLNNGIFEFLHKKYILLIIAMLYINWLVYKKQKIIRIFIISLTLLYLLFPKGISKYYLLGVIPYLSIGLKNYVKSNQFLFVIVFMFRPFYFMVIIVCLFVYIKSKNELKYLQIKIEKLEYCIIGVVIIFSLIFISINKVYLLHVIMLSILGLYIYNTNLYLTFSIKNSEVYIDKVSLIN